MARKITNSRSYTRDGQQSSFATRMNQKSSGLRITFLQGCSSSTQWKYGGGAVPDSVMRYLNENPWDRLKKSKPLSVMYPN